MSDAWIVRVFAYLGFHHDEEVERWMMKHPEYDHTVFTSEGLVLIKFDILADREMLRDFFKFWKGRDGVELFSLQEIDVDEALMKFHDENPSYTVLGGGGSVSPPSHDESLTSARASHPVGEKSPTSAMQGVEE